MQKIITHIATSRSIEEVGFQELEEEQRHLIIIKYLEIFLRLQYSNVNWRMNSGEYLVENKVYLEQLSTEMLATTCQEF